MEINRREVLKKTALLGLTIGTIANASETNKSEINLNEINFRYAPQFYIGNPEAKARVDFIFSVRCKDTRKFVQNILFDLLENAYKTNKICIVFHHCIKDTKKEFKVGKELLNVNPNDYPYFMLSLLSWTARNDKGIGFKRAKKFKKKLGFVRQKDFNKKDAELMLSAIRVHVDELGVTESPSLFINNKHVGMVLEKDSFNKLLLNETGYKI